MLCERKSVCCVSADLCPASGCRVAPLRSAGTRRLAVLGRMSPNTYEIARIASLSAVGQQNQGPTISTHRGRALLPRKHGRHGLGRRDPAAPEGHRCAAGAPCCGRGPRLDGRWRRRGSLAAAAVPVTRTCRDDGPFWSDGHAILIHGGYNDAGWGRASANVTCFTLPPAAQNRLELSKSTAPSWSMSSNCGHHAVWRHSPPSCPCCLHASRLPNPHMLCCSVPCPRRAMLCCPRRPLPPPLLPAPPAGWPDGARRGVQPL